MWRGGSGVAEPSMTRHYSGYVAGAYVGGKCGRDKVQEFQLR